MKKKATEQDYIKANRRGSREAEIGQYGRPLLHKRVHKSKKVYDRKKSKAGLKNLPYSFFVSRYTASGDIKRLCLRLLPEVRSFAATLSPH